MRVAHFSVFGPRRCGLYHTAKDLVLAERKAGIDAFMVGLDRDTNKPLSPQQDGDFVTAAEKKVFDADILVRHTVIPTIYQSVGIPIVLAMHGRPESSVRLQALKPKENPVISIFDSKTHDQRHKAFVCFWEEYMDIWKYLIPERKLFYVPAPIDLEDYKEAKPYNLGFNNGKPNILIADVWREDVIPMNCLFGAAKFITEACPTGRIHMIGMQDEFINTMRPFMMNMKRQNITGLVGGQQKEVKSFYAACDVVLTPHMIATRIIRESLSMNRPVIAATGCKYTPFQADFFNINSISNALEYWQAHRNMVNPRQSAEKYFSLENTGMAMKKVFDKVLENKSKRRKVFIDIGGHLGESVRQFYMQVPHSNEYDIYTFEPDRTCFNAIDVLFSEAKNVEVINACLGREDGFTDYYPGNANTSEGGTIVTGKQTGAVAYDKPEKVQCINFARWLRENIDEDDYVIVKMNIEGGEYDLMEQLLDEDLTGLIDKCFIQLHSNKFTMGEQRDRFNRIEHRFWKEAKCIKQMGNKEVFDFGQ